LQNVHSSDDELEAENRLVIQTYHG